MIMIFLCAMLACNEQDTASECDCTCSGCECECEVEWLMYWIQNGLVYFVQY